MAGSTCSSIVSPGNTRSAGWLRWLSLTKALTRAKTSFDLWRNLLGSRWVAWSKRVEGIPRPKHNDKPQSRDVMLVSLSLIVASYAVISFGCILSQSRNSVAEEMWSYVALLQDPLCFAFGKRPQAKQHLVDFVSNSEPLWYTQHGTHSPCCGRLEPPFLPAT